MSTDLVLLSRDDLDGALYQAARQAAEAVIAQFSSPSVDKLLTAKEAASLVGVHENTLAYKLANKRGFPASINVGAGEKKPARRWRKSDIEKWMKQ